MQGQFYLYEDPRLSEALKTAGWDDNKVSLLAKHKDGIYAGWPKHRAIFIANTKLYHMAMNII
jgi:hypothetical protein